jgi:hypothetical protein
MSPRPWQHDPIDVDWQLNVLQLSFTELAYGHVDLVLDLPGDVLGQADPAGLSQRLDPRRDVHPIAVYMAVTALHHVAEMEANPDLDASL